MAELHIPTSEQVYLLNHELIAHANELQDPVITVGGQAVFYWASYYQELYPATEQPDERALRSVDIDYVSRKRNVIGIGKALNIEPKFQEPFTPPSIAIFSLIDRDTAKIKEFGGRLFSNADIQYRENIIDIIDRPSGFQHDEFTGEKLLLNTEPFITRHIKSGVPESHDLVRVLNPVACMRSRFANIAEKIKPDTETESLRIKSLMLPVFYFLLDKFEFEHFRHARRFLDSFIQLTQHSAWRRIQTRQNIPLYKILEQLYIFLSANRKDYELDDKFIDRELCKKARETRALFERLQKVSRTSG
ncbi:hypothetical protein AB6T85_14330 [Erwinia sp. ACCC 02193]|jgi:hypothetical protein|uniref:Nucleotidyltransferase n=1 Tax=Erwinia aeris TaxID=3239803 RepID=A0ABV4E9T4_9GAMM